MERLDYLIWMIYKKRIGKIKTHLLLIKWFISLRIMKLAMKKPKFQRDLI